MPVINKGVDAYTRASTSEFWSSVMFEVILDCVCNPVTFLLEWLSEHDLSVLTKIMSEFS